MSRWSRRDWPVWNDQPRSGVATGTCRPTGWPVPPAAIATYCGTTRIMSLAREGLVAIADTYSHAAEDALRQAQIQGRSYEDALRHVEGYVERLQQTDAEHPSIAGLRTELQRLRVQDADQLEALRSTLRQLQATGEAWVRVQESSQASDYEAFLGTYGGKSFCPASPSQAQGVRGNNSTLGGDQRFDARRRLRRLSARYSERTPWVRRRWSVGKRLTAAGRTGRDAGNPCLGRKSGTRLRCRMSRPF